jgi:hypothetical protein
MQLLEPSGWLVLPPFARGTRCVENLRAQSLSIQTFTTQAASTILVAANVQDRFDVLGRERRVLGWRLERAGYAATVAGQRHDAAGVALAGNESSLISSVWTNSSR